MIATLLWCTMYTNRRNVFFFCINFVLFVRCLMQIDRPHAGASTAVNLFGADSVLLCQLVKTLAVCLEVNSATRKVDDKG